MKTPIRAAIISMKENTVPAFGSFTGLVPPTFQPTRIYNGMYESRLSIYNGRMVLHQQITVYDGEYGPGGVAKAIVYSNVDEFNREFIAAEV